LSMLWLRRFCSIAAVAAHIVVTVFDSVNENKF